MRSTSQDKNDEFLPKLRALIQDFEKEFAADPNLSHDDIHVQFVDKLLYLLHWPLDAASYRRQQAQPDDAGKPDAMLRPQGNPLIALEVKRPEEPVAHRIPDIAQGSPYNYKELPPGIREKLRYVMYKGAQARWLMLISPTHLHIFDSQTKRWVLTFNSAQEMINRADHLRLLDFIAVTEEHSLDHLARQFTAKPVDTLLDSLNEWRLRLAQSLWDMNPGISLDLVQAAVRRILDRLIIIQIIDDKGLIREHPGLLDWQIDQWARDREHPMGGLQPLINRLQSMFSEFNQRYNSTIFERDSIDELAYDDQALAEVAAGVAGTGFALLDARIIGTAYEKYAGYKLETKDGILQRSIDPRFRHSTGTYYTPDWVVKYVAERTTCPLLQGKTVADIQDFRVLDKACGSGSFLLGAFDVLADYYDSERKKLQQAIIETKDAKERQALADLLALTENYPRRILERHIYGVDLNPEAAEFATVSLIVHALEYEKDRGGTPETLRLPLILNQNIKVGNSLISALDTMEDDSREEWLNEHQGELGAIRDLREELHGIDDENEKQAAIEAIRGLIEEVNWGEEGLSRRLVRHFKSIEEAREERPFNWEVEFPEAFDPSLPPHERGFDCDIGNPPYIRIQQMREYDSTQVDYLTASPIYRSKGSYDVYVLFLERAAQLTKGSAGFIVSRKFFYQTYGQEIRRLLGEDRCLRELVDFTHLQVFKESDATTYTCLLILGQPQTEHPLRLARVSHLDEQGTQVALMPKDGAWSAEGVRADYVSAGRFTADPWVPAFDDERAVMDRMEEHSESLGTIGARIFVGIQTSADDVYIMDYHGQEGDYYVVRSRMAGMEDKPLKIEKGILRPLLSGEDVRAFGKPSLRQLLLFPYDIVQEETKRGPENKALLIPWEKLEDRYPNAASYLKKHEETLRGREKGKMDHDRWYGYVYPKNMTIQEGRKLAVPSLVDRVRCLFDDAGSWYLDNVDVCGLRLPDGSVSYEAATALLNSTPFSWYAGLVSPPFESRFYRVNKQFLATFPVPRTLVDGPAAAPLAVLTQEMESLVQLRSKLCTDFRVFVQGLVRDRTIGDILKATKPRDKQILDNAAASQKLMYVRHLEAIPSGDWLVLRPILRDAVTGEECELDLHQLRVSEPTAGLLLRYLPTLLPNEYSTARGSSVLAKIERVSIPNGSDGEIQAAIDAYEREKAEAERLDRAIAEAQAQVDSICADLYGLLPEHLAIMGLEKGN